MIHCHFKPSTTDDTESGVKSYSVARMIQQNLSRMHCQPTVHSIIVSIRYQIFKKALPKTR